MQHHSPGRLGVAPHPEASENRCRGSQLLQGVRAAYVIDEDTLRLAGRRQKVAVLLGVGRIAHWYAPFVHEELAGEVAKLRLADEHQILGFATTYGELGFRSLVTYGPGIKSPEALWRQATHLDRKTGKRSMGGDPLPWIRAHASGIYVCLAISNALTSGLSTKRLRALLDSFYGMPYGDAVELGTIETARSGQKPLDAARDLRALIINANLRRVHRYVSVDEKGKPRSFFGYSAPVDVVYWHLANLIDGGTVKRCEAEGCGGIFIQADPRQRYCPKRWRQRESSCAMRQRQRQGRK